MCDRYFVVFPNKAVPEPGMILNRALKNLKSEDVKLHPDAFFKPIYPKKRDGKLREVKKNVAVSKQTKDHILRQNVSDIAKRTRNLGLLLTQFHWNGLLTLEQGRIIMTQNDDTLRAIAMYRMLLKKDPQGFQKFINALHMSGNHEIANLIEACQNRNGWRNMDEKTPKKKKSSAETGSNENQGTSATLVQKMSILSTISEDLEVCMDSVSTSCATGQQVSKESESAECFVRAYPEEKSKPLYPLGYRSRHASYHTHDKIFVRSRKEPHCGPKKTKAHAHQKENQFSKFFGLFRS